MSKQTGKRAAAMAALLATSAEADDLAESAIYLPPDERELVMQRVREIRLSGIRAASPPPRPPRLPASPPPPKLPGTPTTGFYLYRLWAAHDRLLYVGVSAALRDRLRSHHRRLGDLIDHVTWEEYPDALSMLDAESEAIREEDPALNRAGVG